MLKSRMFGCVTHKSWNCTQNFFLQILQAKKIQNASELHSKQLRFWTHKSWTCAHNFLCKRYRQRTSKMCANFKAKTLVLGRKNLENSSRTFSANLVGGELPKCVWSSRQTASFWTQKRRKCAQKFFIKLAWRKLPKCVWTSQQTTSFLHA